MSNPSIEAVNLSKRYGSFLALSNLSLKIEGSKCVGFLGPNGAGKTTTLKIFTDMIRATEGKALINGIDVHLNKKKALSSVGSLIERPDPRRIRIHFAGGIQNQERLLLDLASMKIGMISFHPSASALEETYLKLIKDTL